jgi:hypothetical protein
MSIDPQFFKQRIGSFDETLPGPVLRVDDGDVRLGLVVAGAELDAWPLDRQTRRVVRGERIVQQALQICRDMIVRDGGGRHHHGDAGDQLPPFMIGTAVLEGAESLPGHPSGARILLDVEAHDVSAGWIGDRARPQPR